MKLLFMNILLITSVLLNLWIPYAGGDFVIWKRRMAKSFWNFFSTFGDKMTKSTSYSWYRFESTFTDLDVSWDGKAAEYFYYIEHRRRAQRYRHWKRIKIEAEKSLNAVGNNYISWFHPIQKLRNIYNKSSLEEEVAKIRTKFKRASEKKNYEFYCRAELEAKRRKICAWTLLNGKLGEFNWKVDDTVLPVCEYRRVSLQHYPLNTKGTFLSCPYKIEQGINHQEKIIRYVKAIKNPPEYRLILYMLEENIENPDGFRKPPKRLSEPSRTSNNNNSFHESSRISYPKIDTSTSTEPQHQYFYPPQNQPSNPQYAYIDPTQITQLPPHQFPKYSNNLEPGYPSIHQQSSQSQYVGAKPVDNPYILSGPFNRMKNAVSFMGSKSDTAPPTQILKPEYMKPALRVVYVLMNKRFSDDPLDALIF